MATKINKKIILHFIKLDNHEIITDYTLNQIKAFAYVRIACHELNTIKFLIY